MKLTEYPLSRLRDQTIQKTQIYAACAPRPRASDPPRPKTRPAPGSTAISISATYAEAAAIDAGLSSVPMAAPALAPAAAPHRRLAALGRHLAAPSAAAAKSVDPVSGPSAGMEITAVKCYPTWQGSRNICLVKVECAGGLYGWGEAGLSGRELAVAGGQWPDSERAALPFCMRTRCSARQSRTRRRQATAIDMTECVAGRQVRSITSGSSLSGRTGCALGRFGKKCTAASTLRVAAH